MKARMPRVCIRLQLAVNKADWKYDIQDHISFWPLLKIKHHYANALSV